MKFYAKFVNLPFVYTSTECGNIAQAKKFFSEFRDDAIIFSEKTPAISFDQYHSQSFKYIPSSQLHSISQKIRLNGKLSNGEELELAVDKWRNITEQLKNIGSFNKVPGIKKAVIFKLNNTDYSFCVPVTKALIDWAIEVSGYSEEEVKKNKIVEQIKKNDTFPIYIFTKNEIKESKALNKDVKLIGQ